MRRSAWGACGAGWVSRMGSGRLLVWVIVGYEGDDVVGGEAFATVKVGELYEEGYARYDAAGVLDELAHGAGGAAGGEEVIGDEHLGAGQYGVVVGLEGIGAVLELVGGGDGLARELVR